LIWSTLAGIVALLGFTLWAALHRATCAWLRARDRQRAILRALFMFGCVLVDGHGKFIRRDVP
jgi:hypothetical protein